MSYRTGVPVSNWSPPLNRYSSSPPIARPATQQITALQYLAQTASNTQNSLSPVTSIIEGGIDRLVENIRALIIEAKRLGLGIRQIIAGLDNMVRQKDFILDYAKFSVAELSRAIDLALDGTILEATPVQGLIESKSPRPSGSNRTTLPTALAPPPSFSAPVSASVYSRVQMPYDQAIQPPVMLPSPPSRRSSPLRSPPPKTSSTGVAMSVINTGK